jgi:hypothetical protein
VSPVVEFGWGWRGAGRARVGLLSWWPDCGAVVVDGPDGLDLLGFVGDNEAQVRRRLAGWEEMADQPNALAWAWARVAGQAAPFGEVGDCRPAASGGPGP